MKKAIFSTLRLYFFSTSNAGGQAPSFDGVDGGTLKDATDILELSQCDAIITCQGGDYTKQVHSALRDSGWHGYWIDAASSLRMQEDAIIILDPINRDVIDKALADGKKETLLAATVQSA